MSEFKKYLLEGLNKTGLTQKELAKQSSVSEVTISRIMNGDVLKPSVKVRFNIGYAMHNNGFVHFD